MEIFYYPHKPNVPVFMSLLPQNPEEMRSTPHVSLFNKIPKGVQLVVVVLAVLLVGVVSTLFLRGVNVTPEQTDSILADEGFYAEAVNTSSIEICNSITDEESKQSCYIAVQDRITYLDTLEQSTGEDVDIISPDYERLYEENPENVNNILDLATSQAFTAMYNESGEVDTEMVARSFALIGEAKLLEPENVKVYVTEGNIYGMGGQFDEALTAYDKSLELDPTNLEALLGKASVYKNTKLYDEAILAYEKALELDTNKIYTEMLIDVELCALYTEVLQTEKALDKCTGKGEDVPIESVQDEVEEVLETL